MRIKNAHSDDPKLECSCLSWIEHWNKNRFPNNKGSADRCFCCKKKTDELDGGHVVKIDNPDDKEYIIPLCHECNRSHSDKAFEVDENDLVKTEKSIHCRQ
ncbi:MAG: hypothetical protein GX931_01515 [Acholeplasmataceae bacterium]|nr:hypothetical protein [Acholeplasmataceae bacterium]